MPTENLFPHLWRQVCELDERRRRDWAELTTPAAVTSRQAWVRATVQRMIGPFPERTDLNARVVRTLDRDDYTIELVIFESRPGFHVTGSLYLPKRLTGPLPAVVSPCGHSQNGRCAEPYQRVYISLVKQGFAVLSYDPVSQGERVQYLDAEGRPRVANCCHEHCMAGNQLNLVGGNMANLRIWDGIRAIDYLLSRPEVDADRVAVTGNSGGGTLTTFLLCLDDRLAAGAPGCYVTTLVHRIATRSAADSEQQFVPMLAEGIDHADLLLPAAPNPVLLCAAIKDFFPIEGARLTVADLKRAYGALGAAEKIDICEANEVHGYTKPLREGMVRWFKRHLMGVDEPYAEPEFAIEEDATLYATATGQVLSSLPDAVGVHEIVRRYFPIDLSCRRAADPVAAARAALPKLLGIDPAAAARPWHRPYWQPVKQALAPPPKGVRTETVRFLSDYDVDLTGVFVTPAAAAREAVLLVPDEAGMAPLLARGGRAYELAEQGHLVFTFDPRGVGSDIGALPDWCPPGRYYEFYGIEVDLTYTSWMIGRPLLGQRVFDTLAAAERLKARGLPLTVEGLGAGALLALLAAALDESLAAVRCRGMLLSWANLYQTELYELLPNLLVPDALLHADLPDIAATLAPRPFALVEPIDARRRPVDQATAEAEYAPCRAAYDRAGAGRAFTLTAGAAEELSAREPVPAD